MRYALYLALALLALPPAVEARNRHQALVEAQRLEQSGDYTGVVSVLEDWLAQAKPDPEILMRLAAAQEQLGLIEQAVATWERIVALWPDEPSHYVAAGQRLRQFGHNKRALALLEKGRKSLGLGQAFSWELAELYVGESDYFRAVLAWTDLLETEPQRYLMVEGRLRQLARQPEVAPKLLAAAQEAWKKRKRSTALAQLVVVVALDTGRPQTSFRVLEQAAGGAEMVPLIILFASRCEEYDYDDYAAKGYALVERHCGQAPHHCAQALRRRAQLVLRQQDFAAAAQLYRTMATQLQGRAESVEAQIELARLLLYRLDDTQEALTVLQAALKAEGRGQRAGEILDLLAAAALSQGDLDNARRWLREWARRSGADRTVANYREAELHFFRGDFKVTSQKLEELLQTDPGSAAANDALDLLLLLERYRNREDLLKLFAQAQLLERRGQRQQAQAQWTQLAERAPNYLQRRSLLERARIRGGGGQH